MPCSVGLSVFELRSRCAAQALMGLRDLFSSAAVKGVASPATGVSCEELEDSCEV